MIGTRRVTAVVPARGGSKGVPGKNLRRIGGVSLVHRAIDVAAASSHVDRIVVTSDDHVILAHASERPGVIALERPYELASDDSAMWPTVLHAVDETGGGEIVVLLQPTSPLRSLGDINGAIETFDRLGATSVVTVTPVSKSPHWMYAIGEGGTMTPILPPVEAASRQALPDVHVINGAVYVVEVEHLRRTHRFVDGATRALIMPAERSIDIDTPLDLALAELIFEEGRAERH